MLRVSGLKHASKCVEVVYNKYLLPRMFGIICSLRNQEYFPPSNLSEPSIPPYVERTNEPLEIKRSRSFRRLSSASDKSFSDAEDKHFRVNYFMLSNEYVRKRRKLLKLLYQSRKRGMLENGLILSTFAAKYLPTMNPDMLKDYDRLINLPSNDWDLYYWATGVKVTPSEFDTEIMKMLKDHVRNNDRQSRIRQPDLY